MDSFFTCNGKGSFDQEAPQKNYTTLDQRRITCKYFYFVELIIIFNHLWVTWPGIANQDIHFSQFLVFIPIVQSCSLHSSQLKVIHCIHHCPGNYSSHLYFHRSPLFRVFSSPTACGRCFQVCFRRFQSWQDNLILNLTPSSFNFDYDDRIIGFLSFGFSSLRCHPRFYLSYL